MRACTAMLIGCLSSGCAIGMDTGEFKPARTPHGVRGTVVTTAGPLAGELIEVRDNALVLLADEPAAAAPGAATQRLRLVPFASISRGEFEQLGRSGRLVSGQPPLPRTRERLRLLSRFPQGMPPAVESALLKAYGQDALGGVDR